ncbi:uncharacterized protein [Centruroides vittatus]|uniref:uncharacterized protein n=1 Tax=Centruroides vittatus TaxID=120091 RepID=UPI00350FF38C
MATPAKSYRRIVLKLCKTRAKYEFLSQCRINKAFPMSIYRIRLPMGCESLLPKLKILCLNKAIRSTRRKAYGLLHKLIDVENDLYARDPEMLKDINERTIGLAHSYESNLKRVYIKKLKWLFKCQNIKPARKDTSHITAWDNIVPPTCILSALKFGPLFAPGPSPSPENLIPDIEFIIKGMNSTEQDYIRWKTRFRVAHERRVNFNTRQFLATISKARQWLQSNNVVLMKADKSKGIVLTKRDTYNKKILEYIENTDCQLAPCNYLESSQRRVKRFTATPLARLLNMQKATVLAPKAPRIFAFGKTHKPGCQIRPVIEKCNSPTFRIEKQLVRFIRSKEQNHPFTITNSLQLIEKLKNIALKDDEYMTVMDYESLYPSIKLPPCFCALRDFLFKNIENSYKYHQHILELSDLICYTSFFQFEGRVFLQGRGVPMGSPMSAILCDLVLRQLENTILPGFQNDIILYTRYIDDIFILWNNKHNTQRFLNDINDNPYGLTLQLDQESYNNVHFLDINITCGEGEIKTNIYRKPGLNTIIIPNQSVDPRHIKYAAFRSWIKRAYTHCTNICDTYKELDYILEIATQQGYQRNIVEKLITTFQNRSNHSPADNGKQKMVINYYPFLNKMINEIAKANNIRIVYRRNPTVYKLLRNDKKREDRNSLTGVYSIPIKDQRFNSDIVYVGATLRHLEQRIKEHQYSINKNLDSTVLASYAKQQDIEVLWDQASVIKPTNNRHTIKHLEKLEIYKAQEKTGCINHRDADSLSTAWKSFYKDKQ